MNALALSARIALLIGMILLSPALVAAQQISDLHIDFERFTLPNGLTLIVHEDHRAPVVAVNVWYHVGSKDDAPGATGLAHLFEHLMFSGSEHRDEDYFGVLEPMGATDLNGTTDKDRTNYFQTVPKSALDAVLWMESDRMGFLAGAVDQEKLDAQRSIVRNEILEEAAQPYGSAVDALFENAFPGEHPYRWPVKGDPADLDAVTAEDVRAWTAAHYGASNAVLVVAGDVEAEQVRDKVAHYFGDVPAGATPQRQERWVPHTEGTRRVTTYDDVPQVRTYMAWTVPEWGTEDAAGLSLIADLLAGGPDAPLVRRLMRDEQLATEVNAHHFDLELGGLFVVDATVAPGVDASHVERALDEAIRAFGTAGPQADVLNRVKVRRRAEFVRAMERLGGFGGKSDILAASQVYGGEPDAYLHGLKVEASTTVDDLANVAATWLGEDRLVLSVRPRPAFAEEDGGVDRSAMPTVEEMPAPALPRLERARLDNGLEVVVAGREGAPVLDFRLIVHAGYSADAMALPGTAALTMALLDAGTERYSRTEIAETLEALGAGLRAGSNMDISVATLTGLAEHRAASLELFADVVLHPTFPEEEVAYLRDEQRAVIQQERADPVALAMRLLPGLLYPNGHPYARSLTGSGTDDGIAAITRETLASFHRDWFRPGNATLVVAGATDMEEVLPEIEQAFGGWGAGETPARDVHAPVAGSRTGFYVVDHPGAEQSTILAGALLPSKGANDAAVQVANAIFGGDFTSRLNQNLREDKQWTYGVQSLFFDQVGSRPWAIFAPVATERTADAVREIADEMSAIGSIRPITEEELGRAVRMRVLSQPGRWLTNADLLTALTEMIEYGRSADDLAKDAASYGSLALDPVQEAARASFRSEDMVWVIVGDRALIEPSLLDLGLGPVYALDAAGTEVTRITEGGHP